jgi:hypothetical protein
VRTKSDKEKSMKMRNTVDAPEFGGERVVDHAIDDDAIQSPQHLRTPVPGALRNASCLTKNNSYCFLATYDGRLFGEATKTKYKENE